MTVIPRITDGKQMVMQNFFLGVGGGGRGVVNKVHHDECENCAKHYIKHYIEAFC